MLSKFVIPFRVRQICHSRIFFNFAKLYNFSEIYEFYQLKHGFSFVIYKSFN